MNSKDRKYIERLYHCLTIPFASLGSQSQTTAGIARFHADMRFALPLAKRLMQQIACGELYEGSIDEDLKLLESWHNKRKSQEWQ